MSFKKTFDQLLDEILTDYRNQFPETDASQGSLIFIKSACLSSALWGLYNYQEWISRQIFPDTADPEHMEHHAWVRGIARRAGETDEALLARLLEYIRRPPAGWNKYDYEKWAKEIDHVAQAYCFPLGQGLGTVDVVITADEDYTGSEVPSSHALTGETTGESENKLIDGVATFSGTARPGDIAVNVTTGTEAEVLVVDSDTQLMLSADIFSTGQDYTIKSLTVQVKEYIDGLRPVTASVVRVLPPTVTAQNVTMVVTGSGVNLAALAAEITAYLDDLIPGQKLYLSQLISIAIQSGATNVAVSAPVADVTPGAYEMLRPGVIDVT